MSSPFDRIKIRVGAAVTNGNEVALIYRQRDGHDQYSFPGGNVEPGEDLHHALRRELDEELGLTLPHRTEPLLIAVQDQMVNRPGPTPAPRKLHLVFHLPITPELRATVATIEHDDLSEGAIVWLPVTTASEQHLYPAMGPMLANLTTDRHNTRLLPALTDATYQWK